MLTDDQKKRLDEAALFHQFRNSALHVVLIELLESYRMKAIQDMEALGRINESTLDFVRQIRAANDLKRHIEDTIEGKIAQVQDVADELGVDLDELRIRRELTV